ncbi:MAG: DUF2851 family protein [Prevotellaceae bacterium]|nr:DUF2851 family protein [Prevotellaceae bacterium]
MERLLHYTWRHKLLPLATLRTTDGRIVEVVSPGQYNISNAGPDFFNAKVRLDGELWAGNVEMHTKASDWYRHHHDSDSAYDSVVLHVVEVADMDTVTSQGRRVPTMELHIPEGLMADYRELLTAEKYPPCHKVIPTLPRMKVHSWLNALQTERLERKTIAMTGRVQAMGGSWEDGYFATLARNFGFGINGEAFEAWAQCMPMRAVDKHRDNLFQVESMFLGQAALLDRVDSRYSAEYKYLQRKFGMTPMDGTIWRYLRTRPQNFPHRRLMQLALMHHERRTSLGALLECRSAKDIGNLYGMKGKKLDLLIINTAIPTIFAYGQHHAKEYLCERAYRLLEETGPEDNSIVRLWEDCGLKAENAGDTQALIQLRNEYCDTKNCLRCRFGFEFLTGEHRRAFFSENDEDYTQI